MKPAAFDYCCPDSVDEAVSTLARWGDDAKLMAGGQSLLPMMNFRVVRPAMVIDIRRLLELDYVREADDGGLSIGALTRHRVLETSPIVARRFPIIAEAMRHVAHLAIRNRGTIGGSLSHADPAAELPMLVGLLDGLIVVQSVRGSRSIAAKDFFVGSLATTLKADEMVVRIDLPGRPPSGWAFEEFARRTGDYALAAVGVELQADAGRICRARVAMMGVADTPIRRLQAEQVLTGAPLDETCIARAVAAACDGLAPRQDLHASADYRRHLAAALLRRALHLAWTRAQGDKA